MENSDYYILDNSDIELQKQEAAKTLYNSGNYMGALKLYLDMVNASYSYKLHFETGRCYYKLGDFKNAELYFQSSISLEKIKNPSYVFLGNIFHKNGEISKAIEYWSLAFSYKPDDESVCLNLASSYFAKEMRYQALFFYEKFLRYAKDKTTAHYLEVKKTIDNFAGMGKDFYQKALRALEADDVATAEQGLVYAAKNFPANFDINFLLSKLYWNSKDYMRSMIFLRQAYCVDNKSLDVLQLLAASLLNIGDYTSAFGCYKRMLPLVLNNQKEYLHVIQTLKELEQGFDKQSAQGHLELAQEYYNDNNYHQALFEYENAIFIDNSLMNKYDNKIQELKRFLNPEDRIIKLCFEKAAYCYSNKDYRQANKYFSKIMVLAKSDSSDYKMAKSRLTNV